MTDATETQSLAGDASPPRRARSVRRMIFRALWSIVFGLVMLCVVTIGLIATMGQTVNAPDWMRAELAQRAERSVDGAMQFSFGDISLVVGEGWRPRLRFRDLVLHQPDGQEILRLSDTEVSFSVSNLLQGEIRPKTVLLTGVFATLRTDRSGAVALSFGESAEPLGEAQNMAPLIESWDVALEQPFLRALTKLEMRALTLRYEDARAGRGWTVDGGNVLVARDGQDVRLTGSFALLSGRDYAATIEANYSSRIGDLAAEFGVAVTDIAAEDIATQSVAVAWLEILRAPISGAFRGQIGADGALGPVNATLQIGPGVLQPTDSTRPLPFDDARSYFTYSPADHKLEFHELSLDSSWASGLADGTAYLNGVETGRLTDLVGQFQLSDFRLNSDGMYDEAMELAAANADFRLELNPFHLKLGQLQIADGDSTVVVSGDLLAEAEGWDLSLDGWMDRLTPTRLLEVWPQNAAQKPREWVRKNLLGGLLHGLNFALRARPGAPPDLYMDFDFSDAEIQFANWLPPLTQAEGFATMVDRRFVATASAGVVDSGEHGALDASGTSFIIPDVSVKPAAPALARIEVEGPIAAVMALLNRPPVSILKNSTLPVALAKGTARASGTLTLPLMKGTKFEDTQLHLSGVVEDVDSTGQVPGHRITARSMDVDVTNDWVILSGKGALSGVPVTATWRQKLGKGAPSASKLTGTVELSQRAVEAFGIGLPKGSVGGLGQGDVEIDLVSGKPPQLRLRSDLSGVRLSLSSLGWRKREAATGTLEVDATLSSQPAVDRLSVKAAGLTAQGRVTTRADGGLDRASFSTVRVGNWFNAPVDIVGQGSSRPVALEIRGGKLDMQKATFGESDGETGAIRIALNELRITETIALNDFRGQFQGGAGMTGTFSGLLGGRTPVSGDVSPQNGRSAFRVKSADAGGVLRDSGLLTQAREGSFTMTLVPVDGPGNYDGSARIQNMRVINAPAIAALLDAVSIIGLIDELAGPGIFFTQVDTRFNLAPDRMTVYEGSAVGPSMGISMDGHYDISSDKLDMRGVISPLYLINGIGSVLTRKGEGLIGFYYDLDGSAANPKVLVNPLSALAPGILRDAFRKPPPKNPNAPQQKAPSRASTAAPLPQDRSGSFEGR